MGLIPPTSRSVSVGGADPLAQALGYVNWVADPALISSGTTLTSQQIEAYGIWLPVGVTVTGVVLWIVAAGSGTTPTGFFVGLASDAKMLVQSGNLNASSSLTTLGPQQFAFSATHVTTPSETSNGLYRVMLLENGAFGTTGVAVGRNLSVNQIGDALTGAHRLFGIAGTGQTSLPANGSAVTVTNGGAGFIVGVY